MIVEWIKEAGWVAWVQVFGVLAGSFWALVCAALLGMKWRVPPIVTAVPLALTPLVAAIAGSISSGKVDDAVRGADPAQRATLMAAGISEVLHGSVLLAAVLPAAMLLGLGGAAAGVRPPRAWGSSVIAFLLLSFASVLPAADLFYGAGGAGVLLRCLVYGLGVIPVTMSLVNNGMQTNGREASVTASLAYFSVVAALEMAVTGSGWIQAFSALAMVDPAQKAAIAAAASAELNGPGWLGNIRLGLALLVVILAAFRPVAQPTEEEILAGNFNPSPARTLGMILALGTPLFWVMAMVSLDASETFSRLMVFWSK